MRSTITLVVAAVFSLPTLNGPLLAALDVTSISYSYSQDFDVGLFDTVNSMNWQNDSTLGGWSLFRVNADPSQAPVPIHAYLMNESSSTFGRFYSFGTVSSERTLGGIGHTAFGDGISTPPAVSGIADNAAAGWIAVSFLNLTGTTLTQINVNYTGEQWRDAVANPQTMEFEYGIGSTFATVQTWTKPGSAFNFTSPVFTGDFVAIDGNASGNRTEGLGGTVTGLNWEADKILWLRWIEKNDEFADHGLAIDDFTFSLGSTAVPEPGVALFGGVVCGLIVLLVITRRFGVKVVVAYSQARS